MRVILIHNHYQILGGEDQVFAAECALLESHGHLVQRYTVHNDELKMLSKMTLARKTLWNQARYQELRRLFQRYQPNVVHVHNTMPLISPAIYHAAKSEKIPICQTLHNYRLICPNALFFQHDRVCEDCIGQPLAWPGVRHACYRRSRSATTIIALMNAFHRLLGTWENKIDIYIALSEFSKQKFIQAGFPQQKIMIKPNFVNRKPFYFESDLANKRNGALFVGRLSQEKGIATLLKAWKIIISNLPLTIVGDGPLKHVVQSAASCTHNICWLGQQTIKEVYTLMAKAETLVFPSRCYETFGRVAIEAFAHGTPVIASRIGAIAEIVTHHRTGLLFEPGNAIDLAEKVRWANEHPAEMNRMGRNARAEYEAKYTPEKNYHMLMAIYEQAIENHHRRQRNIARH